MMKKAFLVMTILILCLAVLAGCTKQIGLASSGTPAAATPTPELTTEAPTPTVQVTSPVPTPQTTGVVTPPEVPNFVVLPTPSVAVLPSAQTTTMYARNFGDAISVFEHPETGSAQVASVFAHDAVTVIEMTGTWGEWAKVSCEDRDGGGTKTGYVPNGYLAAHFLPFLPEEGRTLEDFVCEDWHLVDSAACDYNQDGMADYVGVLAHKSLTDETLAIEERNLTRILFVIASTQSGRYVLDFQDEVLVEEPQTIEGELLDVFKSVTAEDSTFTIHNFREHVDATTGNTIQNDHSYTFTYTEGSWYLTYDLWVSHWGDVFLGESSNDYEAGAHIEYWYSVELLVRLKSQGQPVPPDEPEFSNDYLIGSPELLQTISRRMAYRVG